MMTCKFIIPETIKGKMELINELSKLTIDAIKQEDIKYAKELMLYELMVLDKVDLDFIERLCGKEDRESLEEVKESLIKGLATI